MSKSGPHQVMYFATPAKARSLPILQLGSYAEVICSWSQQQGLEAQDLNHCTKLLPTYYYGYTHMHTQRLAIINTHKGPE